MPMLAKRKPSFHNVAGLGEALAPKNGPEPRKDKVDTNILEETNEIQIFPD